MKNTLILAALLASTSFAFADEPTANDLPAILQKLRGCSSSMLGGESCRIAKSDLWASINSDGELTLFRNRSYGDTTYAHGRTVSELLRDFAAKINSDNEANKAMLTALAPYLPSQ